MTSPDDLRRCVDTLEALIADPSRLLDVPDELRGALLSAAGRLRPVDRVHKRRHNKAEKAKKREEKASKDRALVASTRIRMLRKAPVFVAPPKLIGGNTAAAPADPAPRPRLEVPR